ncbi:hypothetical protein GCM10027614_24720 [Micromonospora vulcania]
MGRALALMFLGLTGVVAVATPAHAGVWRTDENTAYTTEAKCHAAGAVWQSHYCTLTTYPKGAGRGGTRGWYLSYFVN